MERTVGRWSCLLNKIKNCENFKAWTIVSNTNLPTMICAECKIQDKKANFNTMLFIISIHIFATFF